MSRTGVGSSVPPATSRTRPSFSMTSARPSGRKAKPVGKLSPLTTISSPKLLAGRPPAAAIPWAAGGARRRHRRRRLAAPDAAGLLLARLRLGGGQRRRLRRRSRWRAPPRPRTRAAATDRPSGVLTWYIRRLRVSRTVPGSSRKATPRPTSDWSCARAASPQAVPYGGASMPRMPTPTRLPSIDASRVLPSMTRTKPAGRNEPGPRLRGAARRGRLLVEGLDGAEAHHHKTETQYRHKPARQAGARRSFHRLPRTRSPSRCR